MRLFLIFIATFIYASNLIDTYRFYGIKPTVNEIEKKLTSTDYWLNRLKNKYVRWGYYEDKKDILVCIKNEKTLEVLKNKKNGFDLIDKIDVLTGLDGDKEKEGDLKTPLGVYRLKSILENVDKFYGPFAFETSYPNMLDKLKNKDGHGIWIHGKPLKGNRDNNNTKGCIVMDNDKLEKLKNEINYKNTYLLISETTPLTATKEEIAKILAFIYKWRRAWRESNFDKYKTFYDASFKKYDGMNLKDFLDYKKRILKSKRYQKVEIYFKDINIIPYQNIKQEKIFRIDMYEDYISPTYKYSGGKEVYVKFTPDGIKIIAEK